MTTNMNSGYHGYSMSNRAYQAYQNDEMPKSKWTKKAIIEELEKMNLTEEKMNTFKAMKKEELFSTVMVWSSWHHTSKMCNKTDFYKVREDLIEEDFEEELQEEKTEELKRLIYNLKSIRELDHALRASGVSPKSSMEILDGKLEALNKNLKFFDAYDVRLDLLWYEKKLANGEKL